ncbi:histidine kinase [[Phormidium ambiguum] IAM M-71]|uniref:Histidine kinase n=1 Tax=[Phormidium ambiguum] IAM M-71 TaxID=454136 RepID=A0A1U7I3M3_9CYAN|nr:CHASE2 domain-containing protein [Phormidium ambiguum]OKH30671.1 histidine kinase [Phormidium ambiguum IAM M-71]
MRYGFVKKIKEEITFNRLVIVLPGFVSISLIIIARLTGVLQPLEWLVFDRFLRLRPSEPIDKRILIVGINEQDIRNSGNYPIPDRKIAELLRKLQTYQPAVIGLDIFRDLPVEPGHAEIIATFKEIKNLVAIEKIFSENVNPPPSSPPERVGFVDSIPDDDGSLRRSLLQVWYEKGDNKVDKLSFTLKLARTYLLTQKISFNNDSRKIKFGTIELPRLHPNFGGYVRADTGGIQILLNYRSGKERFRIVSLNDIISGKVNADWIRDRIVIIGVTSPSIKDVIITNVTSSKKLTPGLVYGVEIQAHAVSQIISAVLDGRPLLQSWSDKWEYLWIIAWGILGIVFGRISRSPLKNLLAVGFISVILIVISYLLLLWGWWIPVVPTFLIFIIDRIALGLTSFYQYDLALKARISDRQQLIDSTFDAIHNGPLQTLAKLLRTVKEKDLTPDNILSELGYLNQELRAIYEFMQRQNLSEEHSLHLGNNLELNLQVPLHEILYQVYSHTLERDLPYFKTLKFKIRTFDIIDDQSLSIEQKQGICRFLEEALCNVGKHAQGVTRLVVTYTLKDDWYILSITDNGQGNCHLKNEGRGTQQSKNLARHLRGKFQRVPLSPKGTLCQLTWPMKKRLWFW